MRVAVDGYRQAIGSGIIQYKHDYGISLFCGVASSFSQQTAMNSKYAGSHPHQQQQVTD
jgi:hypothetical protein